MANRITISPATEADLTSIKPLLSELMAAMDDTEGFDIEQAVSNCQNLMKDKSHHSLVARDEIAVLGFINFTIRRTVLHPAPSALIDELVVSRKSRGQGIGRLLIDKVVEKCKELGCCELEVSTEKTNRTARGFYRNCGFAEEAVLLEMDLV